MKKFSILIVLGVILCIGLTGVTGYYIGSKTQKHVQESDNENSTSNVDTTTDIDIDELKAQLKEEVRVELYNEVYEEAYDAAYKSIEADLDAKIDELQEEVDKIEEEEKEDDKNKSKEHSKKDTKPTNTNSSNVKPSDSKPAVQAYINVHDVTVSMSGGTAAIEASLNRAVDSSSGTVTCDTSSIAGIGTFPIHWTSTDGATATSNITITE